MILKRPLIELKDKLEQMNTIEHQLMQQQSSSNSSGNQQPAPSKSVQEKQSPEEEKPQASFKKSKPINNCQKIESSKMILIIIKHFNFLPGYVS